ncbi:MAG: Gfo/Idh/MocA family oxidoreductase [Pirellulales bacterium]
MKITPEEREVGIENFFAAAGYKETRAGVLRDTREKGLATKKGLGSQYFKYGEVERPVRIGVIGTGDEGGVLIGALNPKYVQVVAIADIRPFNIYRAFHGDKSTASTRRVRPGLMNIFGWPDEAAARKNVEVYTQGYDELLDDENVEAVIVALPLHLHAEASVKAMRKGKHVLCEKLMAHSVHQCKEMARVAAAEGKLLAVGHQRHYSVLYDTAVDLVKKNVIGRIHHIRAQWHRNNQPGNDTWQKPLPTDPQMAKDLEAAQENMANAETKFAEVRATAKNRVTNEKHLADLKKFDGELVSRPKEIAELRQALAELAKQDQPDAKLQQEHLDRIQKLEDRLAAVNKRYLQIIKLDPKKYDMSVLQDKVELLTHQLKDAEIATKVKDHGYIDRNVGGNEISALEELIRWRLWDRTGGGLMAELGSHQLDAAGIFISAMRNDGKKVHPLSVIGIGGRHIFPNDRDIDDHVYCYFEYPAPDYDSETAAEKKIVVTYSSINGNGYGGYGETVLGTAGTLILEREKEPLLYNTDAACKSTHVRVSGSKGKLKLATTKSGSADARLARDGLKGPLSRGYTEEIEHWAWAILEKAKLAAAALAADDAAEAKPAGPSKPAEIAVPLRCSPKVALADAVIALTANLAIAQGKATEQNARIDFAPEWFDIDSDETPEGEPPNVDRPEYQT